MLMIYGWSGRSPQGLMWLYRNMHQQFLGFDVLPYQEFCKMLNNAACENRTSHKHSWRLKYCNITEEKQA